MHVSKLISTSAALALLPAALAAQSGAPVEQGPKNVPEFEPAFETQTRAPAADSGVELKVEILADGLAHPWGVAPLPSGHVLVTERPGRLRVVSPDGSVSDPVSGLPEVHAVKQGGLLDIATGPDFADDRMIYWTYAKPLADGASATAAARGVLSEDMTEVTQVEDIFVQDPPSPTPMHYGSRVLFDGNGHALITTGEHFTMEERDYAQDLDKTYGKTIRVRLDGEIPEDNPFTGRDDADHVDLVLRPPQHPRRRDPPRHRSVLDHRARTKGRRRVEPDRTRRELRLARDQLRRDL